MIDFVAQLDLRSITGLESHRRIDAVSLKLSEVAEGLALFVECIQPCCKILGNALVKVDSSPPIPERARLQRRLVHICPVGFLERAIDKPAARAAAEGQCTGSLQDFDALRIVEIAEVLNVIAETIDEEVRA